MTWKKIPGFPDCYEINELGQVRSKKYKRDWRILKPQRMKNGYFTVSLEINKVQEKRLLHRLVALAFVPNPEGLKVVNHIDNDRNNYRAENLEWVTQFENMQHAKKIGCKLGRPNTYSDEEIAKIRQLLATGLTQEQVAERMGCSGPYVCLIANGFRS